LEALKQQLTEEFPVLVERHRRPTARLALGQKLANVLTRYAVMDSSDGLADAVTQLGRHSGCVGIIDARRLAVSAEVETLAARCGQHPLDWVLYGGEDFELVVSLSPEMMTLFPELTVIGHMVETQSVAHALSVWPNTEGLLDIEGELMPLLNDRGFQHFRQ
jgi:thiamine-monophosphate kinase